MPQWDNVHGAHVLNFNGRVSESSVKNFQLSGPDHADDVVLQFGRVGPDTFTMDVHHPLGLLQAFGICLASLDAKLADNRAYDQLRRWSTGTRGGDVEEADDDCDG